MDFVLWDLPGDFARWTGITGDFGRGSRGPSPGSGVRERPSESLKLFSLGMVESGGDGCERKKAGRKYRVLVFGCADTTTSTTASGRLSKQPIASRGRVTAIDRS